MFVLQPDRDKQRGIFDGTQGVVVRTAQVEQIAGGQFTVGLPGMCNYCDYILHDKVQNKLDARMLPKTGD